MNNIYFNVFLSANTGMWIFFGTKNNNTFDIIDETHPQYSFVENHMTTCYPTFIDEDKIGLFTNWKRQSFKILKAELKQICLDFINNGFIFDDNFCEEPYENFFGDEGGCGPNPIFTEDDFK